MKQIGLGFALALILVTLCVCAWLIVELSLNLAQPAWIQGLTVLLAGAWLVTILWLAKWLYSEQQRLQSLLFALRCFAHNQIAKEAILYLPFSNGKTTDTIDKITQLLHEQMQQVESSLNKERSFLETLTILEEAVITLDVDDNLLETSSGWKHLTHLAQPTGLRFLGYIHADERMIWSQKKYNLLNEPDKSSIHVRFRLNTNQDAHPWIEGRFFKHLDTHGVLTIRGVLRDVSKNYAQEQQIAHMALHDALTGIANRILLEDRLIQALLLAKRHETQVAVVFFDLDHFKQVNDSLGHHVGDQLLIKVSERIQSCLRASDTLARWGGDEFVILLTDTSRADIEAVIDKVMQAIKEPIITNAHELPVTFSMGIAIYPLDSVDMNSLFSNADRAMFYAKSQGRNQYQFYADMNYKENGKEEIYIQNRLIQALKDRLLSVEFQPIIDCQLGRVHAVEALARWHDEVYGWVSPETFIPIAENHGIIFQLGQQVIEHSLNALAQWKMNGLELRMFINISSRQLFIPGFIPSLLSELESRKLTPNDIVLEVTESLALRDVDHAMARLCDLQQQGFRVAIDDFGTGHSSLAQLHEINADKLKIDKKFIAKVLEEKGYTMVLAISNMAKALDLKTIAEGVETYEQASILSRMGVSYLQGYWFAKPMSAESCYVWIQDFNHQILANKCVSSQ